MDNSKPIIADDVVVKMDSYFGFHMQNIGKEFIDPSGRIYSKLEVYNKFLKFNFLNHPVVDQKALIRLSQNKDDTFKLVDKPGWRNHQLIDRRSWHRDTSDNLYEQ